LLIINFILDLEDFYEPRYVIPIAGMIISNSMNVLSLAIERFEKELKTLSFEEARNNSFKSALIPQINSLLAVGLVSHPGMMTGQILSGIDPLVAVRYQIMIMATILSSAGLSLVIYFILNNKSN
jgi:putative ABC transport system permease protein